MSKTTLLAATAILALSAGSAWAIGLHPSVGITGVKSNAVARPLHSPAPLGGPGILLYSQNPGTGTATGSAWVSDNFTSGLYGTTYDNSGADDFVMPSGSITGGVTEVDVSGQYELTYGVATSQIVSFYTNKAANKKIPFSHPNKLKYTFTLNCVSAPVHGDFQCALPYTTKTKRGVKTYKAAAKLKAGDTYWVSVVANMAFLNSAFTQVKDGEWYWDSLAPVTNDEAVFENPGGGFGASCTTYLPLNGTCLNAFEAEDFMFAIWG